VEAEVVLKMPEMQLPDLINLLWSVQEIGQGSDFFFERLEKEIAARIRQVRDEDFVLLLDCFAEMKSRFSQKFMQLLLSVINDKRDRFQLRTLVHIIFAFAKLDFSNELIIDTLKGFREYERLRGGLSGMQLKSQCILLWTYTRDSRLLEKQFLKNIAEAILTFEGPKLELDNFDILLIVQSIMHLERSEEALSD
jgi:hypothetical protein